MNFQYPHSIFALSHTNISILPFNNQGRTLRLTVQTNLTSHSIGVTFSNRCGTAPLIIGAASLALCNENGVLAPETLVPLTVGGGLSFELLPQEEIESDIVSFPLNPGEYFALNIYYPHEDRVFSGNWLGRTAQRSRPGNFSADPELPGPGLVSRFARTVVVTDMTVAITSVSQINAYCYEPRRVVGCFGDSITQQCNWTDPFTKLLYHNYPGEIALCNLGISGNRLLHDFPDYTGGLNGGMAGVKRFKEDILGLKGLTHAILAIGTNDIGLPGLNGIPESELLSLETYSKAMEDFAAQLHANGVKAYAATITPRSLTKPYTPAREVIRLQCNDWIRKADCFDAVLDFDKVVQRNDGEAGMKDNYALNDGLHPSPFGGLWMAKSIDLSLFGGDADE